MIMRQHTVVLYELYEKFRNFKELNNVMEAWNFTGTYYIGLGYKPQFNHGNSFLLMHATALDRKF